MTRSRLWLIAAVAVIAVVAVAGSLVTPTGRVARAARAGVAPVLSGQLVCPSVSGGSGGATTDMTVAHVRPGRAPTTTYSPVFPVKAPRPVVPLRLQPAAGVHEASRYGAVVVNTSGAGADAVVANQTTLVPSGLQRGLYDVACSAPGTDWWFVNATGFVGIEDLIVMVNPADTPANVDIHLWSTRGPQSPPGTTGVIVAAHSTLVRRVSDLAPDATAVAIHVHANSGTLATALLDHESRGNAPTGGDWMPPTQPPSTSMVVTGFLPNATYELLDLVNPGDRDATVSLRVVTPTKNFVPAGHQNVVVRAGQTSSIDLTQAISGEAAAVVVNSDVPVSAGGVTAERHVGGLQELARLGAQPPLSGPAGIASSVPPFGQSARLILTAPQTAASVRLTTASGTSAVVTVPAGRTGNLDLLKLFRAGPTGPGPLLLTPLSGPVYVVRSLYAVGAHGPLMSVAEPVVLPAATALPPVISDLRAALP